MIKRALKISSRFYSYQKDRFPMVVLAISLFPAILSSGAIMSYGPTFTQMGYALVASIVYLLHIRIIDEHRDFGHDNVHHITRPIQAGLITKDELCYVDILAVSIFIVIAISIGTLALMVAIIMLGYSYLAGREFFIGERIRKHFFTYNAVNLVQMLLMQVFVYIVFANSFTFDKLIIFHFLFTSIGTVIFEFVRKLKIPGDDGSGKDTYTWYLGFDKSIYIYLALLLLNATLFFLVVTIISAHTIILLFFTLGLVILIIPSILIHKKKRTHLTDQIMQLSFLLLYGFFNIAIYFFKIN